MTVTMFSDPTDGGYESVISVPAGPDGDELWVPGPIWMLIDAATAPPFRETVPTQA